MTEWQLPKESAVARGYIVSHNNNQTAMDEEELAGVPDKSGVGLEAEALNG